MGLLQRENNEIIKGKERKHRGSKSVLSEHKYYSIAKDCYLGKHSGV
ncbi:MAG: DUF2250 domain-containing protein [Microcystis aeruginosa W11-06]|nr:DUF2250 domain-containing protein [Microcystis aeruginosa W11-03]NCR96231.1 DUF2250 domain-containing protein [Microcystis aeruginosa W11-06]